MRHRFYGGLVAALALVTATALPRAAAAQARVPDVVRAGVGEGVVLTAEDVGRRAALTSYSATAGEHAVASAAARVDAAWLSWLPRLSGVARYTRFSDFTPPSIAFGAGPPVAIPLVLDQWSFQASVVVPVSDYAFKVSHSVQAAEELATAARHDVAVARAKSWTEGKLAYFAWLTARAGLRVAEATLELQRGLLEDMKGQLSVGRASPADVLQSEAAVAAAELSVQRARGLVTTTEAQVRVAMHASPEAPIAPGDELEVEPARVDGNLDVLVREAYAARHEVKVMEARVQAALGDARVARASQLPSLSAFGEAMYANPNPRRFPPRDEWFGTWAVGVQLAWSPNDVVLGGAGGRDADARASELVARKKLLLDAISLEVTQAYEAVKEARVAMTTSERQLANASEAHRVARELFVSGRATPTQVREADTALTRARLDAVHARALAHTSAVRLEHAVGRVRTSSAPTAA